MSYDAEIIILGSGISALTCASLLSSVFKKKVLLVEKHFKAGGFTHTFRRQGFEWDVGLHYIGGMQSKGFLPNPQRNGFKFFSLISGGQLKWKKLPDPFEHYIFDDFSFHQPVGREKFQKELEALFPEEKMAIAQYFLDLRRVCETAIVHSGRDVLPAPIRMGMAAVKASAMSLGRMTLKEYLDLNFKEPRLKSILSAQWLDYGLTPDQASFFVHAVIASHYLEGAYYPVGGGGKIADECLKVIRANGGDILIDREVVGVRSLDKGIELDVIHQKNGERLQLKAPKVISGIGVENTFSLCGDVFAKELSELKLLPSGFSALSLFVGLSKNPAGVDGGNYWLFSEESKASPLSSPVWISFPGLKGGDFEKPTAVAIAPMSYDLFKSYENTHWKKRPPAYMQFKNELEQGILKRMERQWPNFSEHVKYVELGTPLTTRHFTSHKGGASYGLPAVPRRYELEFLRPKTRLKGLYLTGADICTHGIYGAMTSGILTVSAMMGGRGLIQILKRANEFKDENFL